MITNIKEFKKMNENLLASIGSINPTKKQVFTKSSFGPTFEVLLYNELKSILPHGYKFDVNMWGTKNFLIINDIEGNQTKISLGENTSVYKVKNLVLAKLKLTESATSGNYILEDVITGFLAPYIKDDAEYNLDSDGNKLMIYIDNDDCLFDVLNQHAPEYNIIKLGFDNFCKENDLYNGDVSTTNDSLVLSADIDIVDVRQGNPPQSNEFRR